MTQVPPWLSLTVSLFAGVLAAYVTHRFTVYRSRRSTIAKTVLLYRMGLGQWSAPVKFAMSIGTVERTFEDLYLAFVKLENTGPTDFSTFTLHAFLSDDGYKFVHGATVTPDISHKSVFIGWKPNQLTSYVEICLEPFNAQDTYTIILYISQPHDKEPIEPKISTAHPTNFVSPVGDALLKAGVRASVMFLGGTSLVSLILLSFGVYYLAYVAQVPMNTDPAILLFASAGLIFIALLVTIITTTVASKINEGLERPDTTILS